MLGPTEIKQSQYLFRQMEFQIGLSHAWRGGSAARPGGVVVAAAAPMPAPPVQRRRRVEPCLAELIDGLKLKPAQAESLEQLLDEHEVHDLATAQILDAEDFKEIGIKVVTRKKLLDRLASSKSEA